MGSHAKSSKVTTVATFIVFTIVVVLLKLWKSSGGDVNTIIAIEIIGYGALVVSSVYYLVAHQGQVAARMKAPSLVAAVVFSGCIVYAILSATVGGVKSWHFVWVGSVIGLLLLLKGWVGPLFSAATLCLAAYGMLHAEANHIPLIKSIMYFVFGEVHVALEYVCSAVMAIAALVNAMAVSDFES